MKIVYLPLEAHPICCHPYPFDLIIGHEDALYSVIIGDTQYIGSVEYRSCSKCNDAQERRIEERAADLEKEVLK